MLQQMGSRKYRNGNSRRSARAVVQEHNMYWARILYESRVCIHGRLGFLGGLASVMDYAGHFRLLYKGGWVRVGSRSMSDGARWGDESAMVGIS